MPLVSDTLDALSGTKYFSTLDLKSGYWQIEMHPESREKTAFVTHNGLYEFNVMPFGLTISGASFQRLMGHILRGLEYRFALIYIDDNIIFPKSIDEHLTHLEEVFRRLREANVKLTPKKCSFVKQRIEYLGHVVTPEGIFPDPCKVKVVENFPITASPKELKSFLGLANYYRRFIKGFSEIASPLNGLTKKGVKFCWSESCAVAFDRLNLFEPRITPYNLRNTGLNVTQNSYNSKFRHNSYSFVISRIWNKLPFSVKSTPNLLSFRRL